MFAFGSSMKGLPGVLGNKETLAKYRREQGNMNPFLGSRGTKLYKLEDENNVSKFMRRKPNTEKVWEHGNIGQFWKGTREQGPPPPWETLSMLKELYPDERQELQSAPARKQPRKRFFYVQFYVDMFSYLFYVINVVVLWAGA